MDRAIEAWEGARGAHSSLVFQVIHGIHHHRTLWAGVLYAITITAVLAVVARL